MELSLLEYRRLALMALWTGLIATVGLVFAFIPNLEFVLLAAFLGGVALGKKEGFLVAALGEAIFSAINPIGSGLGFPILYVFQIFSVGLSGFVGGFLTQSEKFQNDRIVQSAILGFIGFLLTLIFDTLTALSFPLSAGIVDGTLWGTLTLGLAFFVMHMISNTVLFALFGPNLVMLVKRTLLMNGLAPN